MVIAPRRTAGHARRRDCRSGCRPRRCVRDDAGHPHDVELKRAALSRLDLNPSTAPGPAALVAALGAGRGSSMW